MTLFNFNIEPHAVDEVSRVKEASSSSSSSSSGSGSGSGKNERRLLTLLRMYTSRRQLRACGSSRFLFSPQDEAGGSVGATKRKKNVWFRRHSLEGVGQSPGGQVRVVRGDDGGFEKFNRGRQPAGGAGSFDFRGIL